MGNENEEEKPTAESRAKAQAEADKVRDDNRRAEELHAIAVLKAQADVDNAVALVQKTQVEITRSEIEVDRYRLDLRLQKVQEAQTLRQEEATLASDIFHNLYHFDSDVSDRTVVECINRLAYWHRVKPESDIEIIFSSPGGNVFAGMKLFDYIQELKRQGHIVTTHTLGMAASMAGILLQAGSIRTMGKEAFILIHEISTVAWGNTSQIEDEALLLKRMQDRVTDIFMDGVHKAKMAGTATDPITRPLFRKSWTRKDWWVTSDQALKFGFVDGVR